jgi:hypothetical protein
VIGFLRFAGLLNAAVWFGAAFCYSLIVGPALHSKPMAALLTAANFDYFSVAIAQVVASRCLQLQVVCAFLALAHVLAVWLYLGKVPARLWRRLLFALVAANLACLLLQPSLRAWHRDAFAARTPPETRKTAARKFNAWQITEDVVNILVAGGLGVYLWRMANPPDQTRFLSASKFRA